MGRLLQFDRISALEAAMTLFWKRGYTATSLPDLLDVMGIARSSFYASFTTKRELFIECLELFGERTLAIVNQYASSVAAQNLPRAFFEATLLDAPHHRVQQGCMMVNTLLELAQVDSGLNDLAAEKLNKIEAAFARAFKQAQQQGLLNIAYTPQELANMVMTINLGLRVQSRKNQPRKKLKSTIETNLSMIGLAA